jgi:hypothetical protein
MLGAMLSKSQFAALMRDNPDATEDDILKLAAEKEATPHQSGQSTLGKVWEWANAPLTDAPSRVAKAAADKIDSPSLDRDPLTAKLEGFKAGAVQGLGDVASSLTSPLNAGLTLLGLGGEAAGARGLLGISRAARGAEAALSAPLVAEGAKNAVEGVSEGDYGKLGAGALEAAGGALGVKGAFKHAFPPEAMARKTAPVPEALLHEDVHPSSSAPSAALAPTLRDSASVPGRVAAEANGPNSVSHGIENEVVSHPPRLAQ